MIVVYPMLTSSNVNPNILPGLAKAVEKYTLVYNTDDILKVVNGNLATVLKYSLPLAVTAGTFYLKTRGVEDVKNILKRFRKESLEEVRGIGRGGLSGGRPSYKDPMVGQSQYQDRLKEPEKPEMGPVKSPMPIKGAGTSKIDIPKSFPETLSLEPTWIQLQTDLKGLQLLGVKVVPFVVESTDSIVDLMLKDVNLKKWSFQAQKYLRKVPRFLFRFMRALRIPMIKDKALTGDPKTDFIYGTTGYGRNMFIALSNLDIEQSSILSDPNAMRRLYKLGWTSIIVTDDVNKTATFCMKEFGGICSQIPFGYIMASQGKGQNEVFKDLEDVKRSAGPFFRMSTNRRKMFGERAVMDRYKEYRRLLD